MHITTLKHRGQGWAGEALAGNGALYRFEWSGDRLRAFRSMGPGLFADGTEAAGFERWVQYPHVWLASPVPPSLRLAVTVRLSIEACR
jgi:hypothetical protein